MSDPATKWALTGPGGKETEALLSHVNRLANLISTDITLGNVETFAQELKQLVKFDRLTSSGADGDKLKLLAASPQPKDEAQPYLLKDSATDWVMKQRKTVIRPDLLQDKQFPSDELALRDGLRAAIHVPLIIKGEAFCSLDLYHTRPDAFREKEQKILEALAAGIAPAVNNARLYQLEKEKRVELEPQAKERMESIAIIPHPL